jgi:PAS domain S-box-containing protein
MNPTGARIRSNGERRLALPVPAELLDARILVVDDNEVDARLIHALLAGSGYRDVAIATAGPEAIAMHTASPFDLVILDVLMPGMDGFHVLARLLATNPETPVPVIMVTAEPEHMRRALEEGARDFMEKPVRVMELCSRVRTALEVGRLMKESQVRYRTLVEQSIAGIYTIEDGKFTYANPRLCEWLGYTREQLSQIPTLDLVVPEDHERVLANRSRRDAGDQEALVASYRLKTRSGDVVHLTFDARIIDQGGRRVIFGIAQDVTERNRARELLVEAESQYRALVEQSFVGIYLVQAGRLIYANPRLCKILGYRLEELVDLSLLDIVVGEDRPLVEDMMRRRSSGDSAAIAQCRARRSDGAIVHLGIETKAIDLAGEKAIVGVVQDVTLREHAREELESANRRLRTLSERVLSVQEEERRRISRELHDDMGQLLVALDIGLHRLGPHVADPSRALLAECISMSANVRERLREISLELHPPHLDQLGLPDALRWLVARHREITGIATECRFSRVEGLRMAPTIEAACYRICQEALNNATRHAHARRIVLELATRRSSLVLRVRDDGVGFDQPAQRAGILKTGSMGLISMEERARLAGGRLEIVSAPGAGTRVSAIFRIAADALAPAVAKEPA